MGAEPGMIAAPGAPNLDESADSSHLDAFVSYSRRDHAFVLRLVAALEQRGRRVWLDADDIPPGAPWRRELGTAIEAADAFIYVISPDSVTSAECEVELDRAVELGKRLVPVLHRPASGVRDVLGGLQYIAIDEEALDDGVDRLLAALDTDHEWVRAHTRWLARALRWQEGDRDRGLLLRGSELKAAEDWLASQADGRRPAPTGLQTGYVVASRQAEKRRLRFLVGAALAAVAVSVALAIAAFLQRGVAIEQRNEARSRALAASSVGQLEVDPERSLLLGLEAARVDRTPEADDALRQALGASHVRATLRGHQGSVARAVFSPDGRTIVTTSRDGSAAVSDAASGRRLRGLHGHRGAVGGVSVSRDGRRILTTGEDGTARLWDAATGRTTAVLGGGRRAIAAAELSADGTQVVTAGKDGAARLWDASSGRQRAASRRGRRPLRAATLRRDGRMVLTAGNDGAARLWNLSTGAGAVLDRRNRVLSTADFSPDGRLAVTVTQAGTARLWRVSSRRRIAELPVALFSATFSPDSRLLVGTSVDGAVRLWQARTGKELRALTGHGSVTLDAAFSADSRMLVSSGSDRTARVWDTATGSPIAVLRGHTGPVNSARFSPDGRQVVTAGSDRTARRWELGAPTVLRLPGAGGVGSAELSPDGGIVLTAGRAQLVRLWDRATGRELLKPPGCHPVAPRYSCLTQTASVGHRGLPPTEAAFDPTGARVVTTGMDGQARVWDTSRGDELATMPGHSATVRRAAFSSDGGKVVTASDDGTARVSRARDGAPIAVLAGHKAVEGAGARTVGVSAAVFDTPGARVLTAGADGTLRVWDALTGRPVDVLRVNDGGVTDAAFSPAGDAVAAPVDAVGSGIWRAASRSSTFAVTTGWSSASSTRATAG